MTRISWQGTFDAAHFIPGHPKCGRLHGHTYGIRVEVEGTVPDEHPGYLVDYADIKAMVMRMDHRVLVPTEHESLTYAQKGGNTHVETPSLRLVGDDEHFCFLPIPETSAEHLAENLVAHLLDALPDYVSWVSVELQETPNTSAYAERERPEEADGSAAA